MGDNIQEKYAKCAISKQNFKSSIEVIKIIKKKISNSLTKYSWLDVYVLQTILLHQILKIACNNIFFSPKSMDNFLNPGNTGKENKKINGTFKILYCKKAG